MKRQSKIIIPIMLAITLALSIVAGTSRQMYVSAESNDIDIEGIVGQYTLDEDSMAAVIYEVSRETGQMIDEGIAEKQEENYKEGAQSPITSRNWNNYGSAAADDCLTSSELEFYTRLSNLSQYYLDNSTIDAYYVNTYGIYAINGVRYNDLGLTSAQAFYVAQWFLYNNPQYYFLKPVFLTTSSAVYIGCHDVAVDGDDRAALTNEIFETIDYLVSTVAQASTSNYETEKYMHDIVCGHLEYGSGPYDQSIYSALVENRTVCAGYAGLMTVLCNASGIDTVTCLSKVHAWNEVYLDGEWYGVDTTWDDSLGKYVFFNVCDANLKAYDSSSMEHTVETSWVNWTPVIADHDYQSSETHTQEIVLTIPEINVFDDDNDPCAFRINWPQVPDASGYEVTFYKDSQYQNVGTTQRVTTLQVHPKKLKLGRTYYFTVRAFRELGGECYYSDYAYGSYTTKEPEPDPEPEPEPVDTFALTVPGNLRIDDVTDTSLKLYWDAVENAEKYQLEIYNDADFSEYLVGGSTAKTSIKITGLQSGQGIYVRVRAYAVHNDAEYVSEYATVAGQTTANQPDPVPETPPADNPPGGQDDEPSEEPVQDQPTPDQPQEPEKTVAAPSELSLSDITETSVKAVWTSVSDATSYDIQISKTADYSSILAQGNTAKVRMNIKGLSEGTVYYVRVRSVLIDGDKRIESEWISNSFTTSTETFTVPVPTNITATNVTDTSAHLLWDAIPNATYHVMVKRLMDASETNGAVGGYKTYYDDVVTSNSVDVTNLDADRSYFIFVVASVDYKGKTYISDCPMATFVTNSAPKPEVITVDTPSGLNIEDITTSSVRAVWNSVDGATYRIQISKVADYSSILAQGNTSKVRMNIKGLSEGTIYYIRVKAFKTVNGQTYESDWISTSTKTDVNKVVVSAPTGVGVQYVSDSASRVYWTSAGDGLKYDFYIYSDAGYTQKLANTTTSKLAMKITGLKKGTTYYISIRTVDGEQKSDWVNVHFTK